MPHVRFEVAWRPRAGGAETPIVAFDHQYPADHAAQYEETQRAGAADAHAGDLLVLRATLLGSDPDAAYVPISEHPPTPTARFLTLDIP